MTYGDVSAQLRELLAWLLERRGIGEQLGGGGSFRIAITDTKTDRARPGQRSTGTVPSS